MQFELIVIVPRRTNFSKQSEPASERERQIAIKGGGGGHKVKFATDHGASQLTLTININQLTLNLTLIDQWNIYVRLSGNKRVFH